MKKIKLCIIAKVVWSSSIKDNHLNLTPVKILSPDFDRIYLIVQSPDSAQYISHHRNIIVFHLPHKKNRVFDYLYFIFRAFIIGVKLNSRARIDIFDASEAIAGGIAAAALKLITKSKMMLHLQGELLNLPEDHLSKTKVRQIHFIVSLVSRFADRIRCVSESVLENAKKAGISKKKLVYIPARCDASNFNPDTNKPAEYLRVKHGTIGKKVVMFIGTFSIHKGLTYLLQAFSRVAKENTETVLMLVGSGGLENELLDLSNTLGIKDKVIFCGKVPYTEIPDYLFIADVFAFPSIDEGLPRAVMEAMSMQVPVVASRVGGIPELIVHKENGLLVNPGDTEGLAEAINYLLHDKAAPRMAVNARNTILNNYNFDKSLKKYRDILYEIANMPHNPKLSA